MYYHYRPINAPTTGAQAFLMDHTKGDRAITHHAQSSPNVREACTIGTKQRI
jgi:hypothetical protein